MISKIVKSKTWPQWSRKIIKKSRRWKIRNLKPRELLLLSKRMPLLPRL